MPDFMSFGEFRERTAAAKIDFHRETITAGLVHPFAASSGLMPKKMAAKFGSLLKAVKDETVEEEFSKMKQYVLNLYEGVQDLPSKYTFVDTGGNLVDCIPIEQQASYLAAVKAGYKFNNKLRTPPAFAEVESKDPPGPHTSDLVPPLNRGLVDIFGKPMVCPEGRVPVIRTSIAKMAKFGSFANFFKRRPPLPVPKKTKGKKGTKGKKKTPPLFPSIVSPDGTEVHRYATCTDDGRGEYFGCSTWVNLWNPPLAPGKMSLSQSWLVGNPQGRMQTIESGWQRDDFAWQTDRPIIFIFYTRDGYGPDSAYYPNIDGFIPHDNNWIIGSGLPGPFSEPGGVQQGFQMLWDLQSDGAWCLFLGSGRSTPQFIGMFRPGFFDGNLGRAADVVQFGGEVATTTLMPGFPRSGGMGSGKAPIQNSSTDFGAVAFQKHVVVKLSANADLTPAELRSAVIDPNYDLRLTNTDDPDWGNFFFYGGPNG